MDRTIVISPKKKIGWNQLTELWAYKELLIILVERNIKVRYKQTVIGWLWVVGQPLLTTLVFTIVFGRMAGIDSDGIPYPIFSFTGLMLWMYFSSTVVGASNSLVAEANLLTKVYFPRIILPLSVLLTGLVDYAVMATVMVGLLFVYHVPITDKIIMLPLVVGATALLAGGLSMWLGSLYVKYRDVKYVLPFGIQILMFLSPVIYPVSLLGKYEVWLGLNPLAGLIQAHRVAWLGYSLTGWREVLVAIGLAMLIFGWGWWYFDREEQYFADEV